MIMSYSENSTPNADVVKSTVLPYFVMLLKYVKISNINTENVQFGRIDFLTRRVVRHAAVSIHRTDFLLACNAAMQTVQLKILYCYRCL